MTAAKKIEWVRVCKADDLLPSIGVCALVRDQQIAIFRIPTTGECYAIDNFDPFSRANVLARGIVGDLKGEPVVASPVYKQHFNLQTGQCVEDEQVTLAHYSVREQDGYIEVAL